MYIISSNAITEGAASLSTEEERGFICDLHLQTKLKMLEIIANYFL